LKKSLLIITPRPPYPLFSGGEHAQFHFIEAMRTQLDVSICFEINNSDYNSNYNDFLELKNIWKDVTFFPLVNIEKQKRIKKIIRWVNCSLYEIKKILYKFLVNEKTAPVDFLRNNSFINHPFLMYKAEFVSHVASISRDHQFDIIQIEFISLAPLVYILPKGPIKVLVHHELRYIRIKREFYLFQNQDDFDICRLEAIRDQEISLLQRFDKIITLTENDKEILSQNISPEKIYVSPATIKIINSQEIDFLPFSDKLVFIGSSIHLPNIDGVRWFLGSVLPLIEKENPDIYLNIIGAWDKHFIKEYSRKNVKFLGFVEKLANPLQNAMLIVPIRIGSGMRLKILEAINHQIPFITTTVGVEGLDFKSNLDCIIADTPENFANEILRLSKNINKQHELVNNATLKLKEFYSFESALQKRLEFYKSLY
jgi:hypothetical protein